MPVLINTDKPVGRYGRALRGHSFMVIAPSTDESMYSLAGTLLLLTFFPVILKCFTLVRTAVNTFVLAEITTACTTFVLCTCVGIDNSYCFLGCPGSRSIGDADGSGQTCRRPQRCPTNLDQQEVHWWPRGPEGVLHLWRLPLKRMPSLSTSVPLLQYIHTVRIVSLFVV